MMRYFIIFLMMLASTIGASAQYNDILYLTNSNVKLLQIDQEDEATLLYFTFTSEKETSYIYISDNIRLKAGGNEYSLKSAGNIPVSHDGKDKSVAGRVGMKVNFVLAFEKAPIDQPFDVIENELSTTAFNFHQIKVNTKSRTRRYDMNVFLEDTPLKPRFIYTVDGCDFKVVKSRGLVIAFCFTTDADNTEEAVIMFDVVNRSGKSVQFSKEDCKITGYKKNKVLQIPLDTYPQEAATPHRRLWKDYVKEVGFPKSRYVRQRWSLLDALNEYAINSKDSVYEDYLVRIKPELEHMPLTSKTIVDGECYGGSVRFSQKKLLKYILECTIDGEKYRYVIRL